VKFSHFLGLCKLTAPNHPLFPWSLIVSTSLKQQQWQTGPNVVTIMMKKSGEKKFQGPSRMSFFNDNIFDEVQGQIMFQHFRDTFSSTHKKLTCL
jgi:hypothetical protein